MDAMSWSFFGQIIAVLGLFLSGIYGAIKYSNRESVEEERANRRRIDATDKRVATLESDMKVLRNMIESQGKLIDAHFQNMQTKIDMIVEKTKQYDSSITSWYERFGPTLEYLKQQANKDQK